MRPAPFDYVRPDSLEAAVDALRTENAAVLAGGQVLLNRLRARLDRPDVVVDISRVPGLDHVRVEGAEFVVGALVRLTDLVSSTGVSSVPALAQAARSVGDPQVRNMATVGGNVLNPDPVSDIAAVLLASNGTLVFRGSDGDRSVPAHEFFVRAAPRPESGELLTELRFGRAGTPSAYVKLSRRAADAAVASAAAFVHAEKGVLTEVGLAFSGSHHHPVRAHTVEQELTGSPFDAGRARAAVEAFSAELRPMDSPHAEPEYRRRMTAVVAVRALQQALSGTETS